MKEQIRAYVEQLFSTSPDTIKIRELKEELISDLTAKYDDLVSQGRSEEEAYKIAVSSIGDVDELIKSYENDKIYNYARRESDRKRSAIFVSLAVGLYIIAVAVQIFFAMFEGNYPIIGTVLMFIIAAVATGIIVYNAMSRPKYKRSDDTIVEEFKEWKHTSSEQFQIYRSVTSVMWTLIVAIYLIISFVFVGWAYTWIIFIIGAALNNIIKLLFQMRSK